VQVQQCLHSERFAARWWKTGGQSKMKVMKSTVTLGLFLALSGGLALADHHETKKTRVGTCEDAKKQQDYFCDQKNAASDSMVALGTACRNAKINVKEACEGIVEKDEVYQSCKMEQKC
jgi:hypothetical protein